jgi:SWI/SNF-related matrix-associated actin-dependent regulator 1 of chromatin subfamily A
LSTQVIEMLNARKIVNSLMQKCKQISNEVKRKIERVVDTNLDNLEANHKLIRQPKVLSTKMQLKSYQVIGMNWLILMHEQKLNSILADEMGLGIENKN